MAPDKVTMVMKVDLKCPCCHKKIDQILPKFPEIEVEAYDFPKGTVTITVVSGNPEEIRDKLYCKGGKTIKCIEIKKPPKKPPPPPPKEDQGTQTHCGPYCEGYGGGKCRRPCRDGCGGGPCRRPSCDGCEGGACRRPCCDGCGGWACPRPCCDVCGGGACPRPCCDGCGGGVRCRPCCEGCGGAWCYRGHAQPVPCYVDFCEKSPYECTIM